MTHDENNLCSRFDAQERRGASLRHRVQSALVPEPVTRPSVDRELTGLPPLERAAEALRYAACGAEYWLSPGGTLRAVLRLSIKLALLIGLPALIVGPVAILLLEGLAAASALLATAAANLATMSLSLIAAVLGFALLAALLRTFVSRK